MTIEQMRAAISDAYPGADWRLKVKRMNTGTVKAVYSRIFIDKKR